MKYLTILFLSCMISGSLFSQENQTTLFIQQQNNNGTGRMQWYFTPEYKNYQAEFSIYHYPDTVQPINVTYDHYLNNLAAGTYLIKANKNDFSPLLAKIKRNITINDTLEIMISPQGNSVDGEIQLINHGSISIRTRLISEMGNPIENTDNYYRNLNRGRYTLVVIFDDDQSDIQVDIP